MQFLKEYRGVLVTAVVALAVGVASYAVVRNDPFAQRTKQLFMFDVSSLYEVDPNLIRFEQTGEIKLKLDVVRAISVGSNDNVYVAGDQAVHQFSPDGGELAIIETEGKPSCLAVGTDTHLSPGRIYVGAGKRIEVFAPDGSPEKIWNLPDDNTILASIAVADRDVFVADAGNRVVLRYDETGQLLGKIGDPARKGRLFNVPSSYFDVAISRAGLLHVANPGALRIETHTYDGEMEIRWGEAGSDISDFFGCCNPSHFAVLPSGGIVTSEKGVPRVKVYSEFGEFEGVVAGPKRLGVAESELGDPRAVQAKAVFDVATDSKGRVLVLDPRQRSVRIFERIEAEGLEAEEADGTAATAVIRPESRFREYELEAPASGSSIPPSVPLDRASNWKETLAGTHSLARRARLDATSKHARHAEIALITTCKTSATAFPSGTMQQTDCERGVTDHES